MSLDIPAQLGPYEIIAPLGSGGMGDVYRARDKRLDREVALKIVHSDVASARFQNEARAIAALTHPNIVNIFDVGSDQGLSYMAMELLEGESLRSVLATGSQPWKRAVKVAGAIADALRYAHAKGIIHRDLKPENVFITKEGLVKVLDFGLARMTMPAPSANTETLTQPGTVVGTIAYMAPEQLRGEPTGPRADIFSLGCVMYEMLAGERPFHRESSGEVIAAILRDSPRDLRTVKPDVPEPLIRVAEHCLEKDPAQRFDSMADFAFALESATEQSSASAPRLRPEQRTRMSSLALRGGALLLAVVGIVVAGRLATSTKTAPPPVNRRISSLAVLPFVNAGNDRSYDYLSDGLTEAIINDLSPVNGFRVMSRSSVFAYKSKNIDPRRVGSQLGVDAVVSGRLLPRKDALTVSVELIDSRDGHQLWGERYDRPIAEMTELERDLASHISDKLKIRLTSADQERIQRRADVDPEAYRLYLQGRYEWNKRTPDGLHKGIDFFRRSIDIDPTYAPAFAGLADSYLLLGSYELLRPREAMPMAREAAMKALAIDDSLADAHASLGLIKHEYEWNWPEAVAEFKRAITLNPNYVFGHEWYGQGLLYRSQFDEGLRELLHAEALDPLSVVAKADVAQAYWIRGQYDLAIAQSIKTIDMEPRFWIAHWFLGFAYIGKGNFELAAKALENAVALGGSPAARGTLGYTYARMGRRDDAMRILRDLRKEAKTRYISPAPFAEIYIGLGDIDHAYAEMERAFTERTSLITLMNVVPITEPMRSDRRYADFKRRVGLP